MVGIVCGMFRLFNLDSSKGKGKGHLRMQNTLNVSLMGDEVHGLDRLWYVSCPKFR